MVAWFRTTKSPASMISTGATVKLSDHTIAIRDAMFAFKNGRSQGTGKLTPRPRRAFGALPRHSERKRVSSRGFGPGAWRHGARSAIAPCHLRDRHACEPDTERADNRGTDKASETRIPIGRRVLPPKGDRRPRSTRYGISRSPLRVDGIIANHWNTPCVIKAS